jgi:hypothetical protein
MIMLYQPLLAAIQRFLTAILRKAVDYMPGLEKN